MDRPTSERLEETTRLGSYEVFRKLARGGMAELFLARGPDGVVVLKKILPKHAENPRYTQLFLDEARLAQSLEHPNIIRSFGPGQDGGTTYFAMEYSFGQDVRTILHRAWTMGEQLPVEHAIHIGSSVAAALHYAHERRRPDGKLLDLVHRDVSPSNILVSYDGAVKLTDFGVAKAATSTVKTRAGTLKGKISYMSPEQARGAVLDRRSDIFSLGIVLWEMITTHRLFRGENDLQTLQLIINQPPRPPSELQPACTPALERIVLRALAQDPAARYQTADELHRDLEQLAREASAASPEAQAKSRGDALAGYLGQLFAPEVRAWQEAKAAGRTLAQHLTSGGDMTIQLTESDFIEAIDLDAMIAAEEDEDEDEDEDGDDDDDPLDRTELATPPQHALTIEGTIGAPRPARQPTPPAALPAVRAPAAGGARAATPAAGMPIAAAAMPGSAPVLAPMPAVPLGAPAPAPLAGPSDELGAPPPGPWSIAHGSSGSTPSAELASVPVPGFSGPPGLGPVSLDGVTIDPVQADRLLRRGLWVAAAIVGLVVLVSIIAALAA